MDPQTQAASPDGDTGPLRPDLSVVHPDAEPAAAALPVASALDARFLTLAGTLGDLVSLHEPGRGCVYASAVARSLLGADPADLIGRNWAELVPHEDTNPFAGNRPAQVSHRLLRPYGPPLVAETGVTPVEENGAVVQLLCVTRGFDTGSWELPDSLRDRLTGLPTREVLVADPRRRPAERFLELARERWELRTVVSPRAARAQIHHLRPVVTPCGHDARRSEAKGAVPAP